MSTGWNKITETIIGAAIEVHRTLGPGLLESTYEACLAFELAERGLKVERQKALPVRYREVLLDCGYRIDLLVEDMVIVELGSGSVSILVDESGDLLQGPDMIAHASFHRWRHPELLMNPPEVVIHEVQADGVRQVFDLLGKGVC